MLLSRASSLLYSITRLPGAGPASRIGDSNLNDRPALTSVGIELIFNSRVTLGLGRRLVPLDRRLQLTRQEDPLSEDFPRICSR